ncbi:MAG: transglycosylase SLT domain-containing protein, partial [Bdellovibrionales bacterium]|nr:transglycosylase SLT domain-containing protein [Bdellovibrionales bacterium]
DTNFFRLAKTLTQAKPFLGQEFQVVGGLSKTYISMNLESDRFCLNFENSETLIEPIQVYSNCPQQEEHIKTLVVSNYHVRSPTDSKLLSLKTLLQLKQTTNSRRRVYLEISRSPWAVNESNDVDLQPVNLVETKLAQYFIPVNIKNPRVMEITKGFEKYRNSTWVQQAIQQQLKQRQQGIQNFFINIQSPLPRLQRLCEQSELPCTLLYILLSESSMFSAKAHEYEKSRIGGSCEVGPWQITYSTGKYILSEDRVQKIKYKKTADDINGQTPSKCSSKIPQCSSSNPSHCYKINENDDRQYLIPATKAALNYFNILFKSFKDDPALAILAYNRGPGSVDRWLSIEIAHDLNFGLHQLIKRKVPGSDYAKRFLAYYFIGADIEKYGLSIENPKAEIPCEWLYNPRSKKCGQP